MSKHNCPKKALNDHGAEIGALLEAIMEKTFELDNTPNPDWSHAGTAAKVESDLEEIARFLNIEGYREE